MTESPIPNPRESQEDEPIAFPPAPPRRARHDGWSPARQHAFIAALLATGMVATAAKAVSMSVNSAYRLRSRAKAESFAAAWDLAIREARQRALDVAVALASNGYVAPQYYRGRFVGMRGGFDDRMLRAVLRNSGVMPDAQRQAKVTNEAVLRNFIGEPSA